LKPSLNSESMMGRAMHMTTRENEDRAAQREARALAAERAARAKSVVKTRREQILRDTAEQLRRGEDLDRTVLPMLYRALAAERIVDASLGFIVTDQDSRTMTLGFIKGFPEEVVQRCLTLDFGQAVCGTVAASGRAMHVTNIQQSLDPLADLVRSAGMTAYACQPLMVDGRMLGTLSFASRTRRSFEPDDLAFFRAIAEHVAVARDRALAASR
jgi:GAF domain-containing protein